MQAMIDDLVPAAQQAIEKHLNAEAMRVAAKVAKGESWEQEVGGEALVGILAEHVYRPGYIPFAEAAFAAAEGERKAYTEDTMSSWLAEVLRIVRNVAVQKVVDISDYTRLRIRYILDEVQAEGGGVAEAARRIRTRLPEMNVTRSERIARTELNSTANAGTYGGVQSAADELGMEIKKKWYASLDDRTRDSHAAAHAAPAIPLTESFDIGGSAMQHPGDFNAPAAEVVNCRCTMLYET